MATIKNITVTKSGAAYNAVMDVVLDIEFKKRPEAIINGCHVVMTEKCLSVRDRDGVWRRYPINIKKDYYYRDAPEKVAEIVLPIGCK